MPLLRRVARPMLASMFIVGGLDAWKHPERYTAEAEPVVAKLSGALPDKVARETKDVVKFDGGVKMVAGTLLGLNRFPRLSALALAGSLVPTTVAGHRFWEEDDPQARAAQQAHFLKNVSMLGGLLIAAADTEGRPSIGWWTRRAARGAAGAVSGAASSAASTTSDAASSVRDALPI